MGNKGSKNESLEKILRTVGKDFFKAGEYVFKEFERFLLEGRKSITIALVGKTGVGKSRLVNALIGKVKAKEGGNLIPETTKVEAFKTEKHGIEIKIWDTPGLQDCSGREDEYLKQISENLKNVDLLLYCVAMNERRLRSDDLAALKKFVDILGTEIWKKVIVVLTLANEVKPSSDEKKSTEEYFNDRLKLFTDAYQKHLKDFGVESDVAFAPAGDIGKQELPICDDWLPVFWLLALEKIDKSAKSAMLRANYDRIKLPSMQTQENDNAKDDEFAVRLNQEQERTLWEIVGPVACRAATQGVKAGALVFGIGAPIGGAAGFIYGAVRGLHKYHAEKKLRSDIEKKQETNEVSTKCKEKPKLKPKPKLPAPDKPDPKGHFRTDVEPDLSQLQISAQTTKVAPPTKPKPKPRMKPKPDMSQSTKPINKHEITLIADK